MIELEQLFQEGLEFVELGHVGLKIESRKHERTKRRT
jgi:hypothetical protein